MRDIEFALFLITAQKKQGEMVEKSNGFERPRVRTPSTVGRQGRIPSNQEMHRQASGLKTTDDGKAKLHLPEFIVHFRNALNKFDKKGTKKKTKRFPLVALCPTSTSEVTDLGTCGKQGTRNI